MVRALSALLLLFCTACGLAEDGRDEDNKYIYIKFYDKAFEAYCLEKFDMSGDGHISRYEAQRVRRMSCPGLGIGSLTDIREFFNLRELDCSGNELTQLDLTACTYLERLDCSDNDLASLDLDGVRGLVWMDCSGNGLPRLDLHSAASLLTLDCRRNALTTLDVASCDANLAGRRAQQSLVDDGLLPRVAEHLLRRTNRTRPAKSRDLGGERSASALSTLICACRRKTPVLRGGSAVSPLSDRPPARLMGGAAPCFLSSVPPDFFIIC